MMESLAERGWCVVLKKLPKKIGWLVDEHGSERVLPDTWLAEAHQVTNLDRFMYAQVAYAKAPGKATKRLLELCNIEEARTGNVKPEPQRTGQTGVYTGEIGNMEA